MATSSFLTTFARQRDPKLLWPAAAVASVLVHGLALGLVRTLAIQTPALPEGEMAPLPIQLVDPPPDLPPLDPSTPDTGAAAEVEGPPAIATPTDAQTAPAAPAMSPAPASPPIATPTLPAAPPVDQPLVTPAPRPSPAPVPPTPAVVTPAPPSPPASVAPPATVSPPPVVTPPTGTSPPMGASPTPPVASETPGQGGQVVPLGLRLDPNGRDIPETPPQLVGNPAIAFQPLASSCGVGNLEALLTGMVATSVQMQLQVEPNGQISNVRLLQSTGSSAVDNLVSCVVKQRLQLQPASSAGVPQLTDAYILTARIQFF